MQSYGKNREGAGGCLLIKFYPRLWNPAALAFLIVNIFAGMLWGTIDTFLYIFLSTDLEANMTLIGESVPMQLLAS